MEEKGGKGLTLRKKGGRRPQVSGPKEISGPLPPKQAPNAGSGNSLAVPRDRAQQGGATSDFVKRRYSTRFNQLPDFGAGAPLVPGVPSIPNQYAGSNLPPSGRGTPTGGPQPIRLDIGALRDPNLQAEKCKNPEPLSPGGMADKSVYRCY